MTSTSIVLLLGRTCRYTTSSQPEKISSLDIERHLPDSWENWVHLRTQYHAYDRTSHCPSRTVYDLRRYSFPPAVLGLDYVIELKPSLSARDGPPQDHSNQISSMLFHFSTVIIHGRTHLRSESKICRPFGCIYSIQTTCLSYEVR